MRKNRALSAVQAWKDWCRSKIILKAICFKAVLKLQHNTVNAALAAWKGFHVLCDAQRQKLTTCIASLRSSELGAAFRTWQSCAAILKELRLILASVVAKWRLRYPLVSSEGRLALKSHMILQSDATSFVNAIGL